MAVTGINTSKISSIQKAIDDYKKAIDSKKITAASKNVVKAIKGSSQETQVRRLCQACDSHANTLTSFLNGYKTRLNDVKAAYAKNDTSSTSISEVTDKLKGLYANKS